jgi:hypothetical protein
MMQEEQKSVSFVTPGASVLLGIVAIVVTIIGVLVIVSAIVDSPSSGPTMFQIGIGFGALVLAALIVGLMAIINPLAISAYLKHQVETGNFEINARATTEFRSANKT